MLWYIRDYQKKPSELLLYDTYISICITKITKMHYLYWDSIPIQNRYLILTDPFYMSFLFCYQGHSVNISANCYNVFGANYTLNLSSCITIIIELSNVSWFLNRCFFRIKRETSLNTTLFQNKITIFNSFKIA